MDEARVAGIEAELWTLRERLLSVLAELGQARTERDWLEAECDRLRRANAELEQRLRQAALPSGVHQFDFGPIGPPQFVPHDPPIKTSPRRDRRGAWLGDKPLWRDGGYTCGISSNATWTTVTR